MTKTRTKHSAAFKTKVALVAFCAEKVFASKSLDLARMGVESRERLRGNEAVAEGKKLIDFWSVADREAEPDEAGYHCGEIKMVFANQNLEKQVKSAVHDLACLRRLDPAVRAAELGALIFVRFLPGGGARHEVLQQVRELLGEEKVKVIDVNENVTALVVVESVDRC